MSGSLNLYSSYNFIDKDPVIDLMRTVSEKQEIGIPRIAAQSGVSEGTIRNWFYGKTKKPQFATVAAVMAAMGYRVDWRRQEGAAILSAREMMDRVIKTIGKAKP